MQTGRIARLSSWVLVLAAGCPGLDAPGSLDASAVSDASEASPPPPQMYFEVPGEGDIVAPGDSIEVRLLLPTGSSAPELALAGSKLADPWTTSGALYECKINIPTNLPRGDVELVATVKDDEAVVHLKVLAAVDTLGEQPVSSDATELTLGTDNLTVRIPKGALAGGTASLFQYDAKDFPALEGERLLSPVYRIDLSAFPEDIHRDITVEQFITADVVNEVLAKPTLVLRLQVVEGDAATGEVAPWSGTASLGLYTDGTGWVEAEIPPQAFHRKGSSTTRWALLEFDSPVGVENLRLCKTKSGGSESCKELMARGDLPSFNVSAESDRLDLKADVKWAAPPPSFSNPLASMRESSSFDGYRVLTGNLARWTGIHPGVDLIAAAGTPVLAALPGDAEAAIYTSGILAVHEKHATSVWRTVYMHVSNVLGFTRVRGGDNLLGEARYEHASVLAPVDDTYSLDCREDNGRGYCRATSQTGMKILCPLADPLPRFWSLAPDCPVDISTELEDAHYVSVELSSIRGFTRSGIALGDPIALSGSTGAPGQPHLHFEVNYASDWHHLDPVTFFPALVDNKSSGSGNGSPVLRYGVEISNPIEPTATVLDLHVLGVDDTTYQGQVGATCPTGGATIADYQPLQLTASDTSISWALGPCLYHTTCDSNNDSRTAMVVFGHETFGTYSSTPMRWTLSALERPPAYFVSEGKAINVSCEIWKCRCNQQFYDAASDCSASCPPASLNCVAPTCMKIDPKTGKVIGGI